MTDEEKIQALLVRYKEIEGERFFKEIFEKNEYLPMREREADVIVDIGALAGEFCAYMYPYAQFKVTTYDRNYIFER